MKTRVCERPSSTSKALHIEGIKGLYSEIIGIFH